MEFSLDTILSHDEVFIITGSRKLQKNKLLLNKLGPIWVRRIMGILGVLLPLILVIGNDLTILDSISAYWYSKMKWVFAGTLIAFGWMLIEYQGYEDTNDDLASTIAGISAIFVVIFPTSQVSPPDITGYLHYIFALSFLITLAVISISLFPKTTESSRLKIIYKACGFGMLISIILMFVSVALNNPFLGYSTVFIFEALAIDFFGLAWLIKGFEKEIY